MQGRKHDIIAQLERQILPLGGFKTLCTDTSVNIGFTAMERAFPNGVFPVGCVHELLSAGPEDLSATNGFVAGLASRFLQWGGVCIWVSHSRCIFPPALKLFNINPEQIIFIDLKRERECLYVMEDALKCNKVSVVVGEIKQVSFKESRRFQLAAEQSRVTALLVRPQTKSINTIACVSRWRIRSLASELQDGLPGVGFPRWNVELLKVRNGYPSQWILEWIAGSFTEVKKQEELSTYSAIRNVG